MSEISINPKVLNEVKEVHAAVSSSNKTWETGSGKAFNFVAQATAIAVQDATDNLRNVSTMSTTAIGVAMTHLITSGDTHTWEPVVKAAQKLVSTCADDFCRIGMHAAEVLRKFPHGEALDTAKDQA